MFGYLCTEISILCLPSWQLPMRPLGGMRVGDGGSHATHATDNGARRMWKVELGEEGATAAASMDELVATNRIPFDNPPSSWSRIFLDTVGFKKNHSGGHKKCHTKFFACEQVFGPSFFPAPRCVFCFFETDCASFRAIFVLPIPPLAHLTAAAITARGAVFGVARAS